MIKLRRLLLHPTVRREVREREIKKGECVKGNGIYKLLKGRISHLSHDKKVFDVYESRDIFLFEVPESYRRKQYFLAETDVIVQWISTSELMRILNKKTYKGVWQKYLSSKMLDYEERIHENRLPPIRRVKAYLLRLAFRRGLASEGFLELETSLGIYQIAEITGTRESDVHASIGDGIQLTQEGFKFIDPGIIAKEIGMSAWFTESIKESIMLNG